MKAVDVCVVQSSEVGRDCGESFDGTTFCMLVVPSETTVCDPPGADEPSPRTTEVEREIGGIAGEVCQLQAQTYP